MDKEKILNKSKIQLISNGALFYSTILFNLKQVWTDVIPTAGVDGIHLFMNPACFINTLTPTQRLWQLAHEVSHIALDHLSRGKNTIFPIYNLAADHVINLSLKTEGYDVPEDRPQDSRFMYMSTEEVYEILVQELPKDFEYECDFKECDKETQQQIQEILIKAITASKLAKETIGTISGEAERLLEEILNPKLSWETLLQNYVDTFINEDYSWRKPNRRYSDIILPSLYSEGIDSIVFCNDASGSVSDEDFNKGLAEFRSVREKLNPRETTIIAFDTEIKNICILQRDKEIPNISYTGYGGTSILPVFEYLKDKQPSLVIIFSDGEFDSIDEIPDYPVLWILTSDYSDSITFGDIIYYE